MNSENSNKIMFWLVVGGLATCVILKMIGF